jgi:uncharacterized protein
VDADQISWQEISTLTAALASAVAADGCPEVVVGVLRGGMVPAVLIAHRLGVRDLRAVALTRTERDGADAPKSSLPVLANPGSLGDLKGRDVLVVDDVAGTGGTMLAAHDLVRGLGAARVRTVACFLNLANWPAQDGGADSEPQLLSYVGRCSVCWVIFPWEDR